MVEEAAKKLIFLVDDDSKMIAVLTKAIQEHGYQVISAGDGLEGLELLKDIVPDMIVSDVEMPIMDGWQFCNIVKTTKHLVAVPFVFLTVRKHLEDRLRGYKSGADLFVTKPFYIPELITKLDSLLRMRDRVTGNGNAGADFAEATTAPLQEKPASMDKLINIMSDPKVDNASPLDSMAKTVQLLFSDSATAQGLTTADHVCNQAVDLFRSGKFLESLELIEDNLKKFPSNKKSKLFIEILKSRIDSATMVALLSEDSIPYHAVQDGSALQPLNLSPLDYYVFSLVDGRSSVRQLDSISSKGKYRTNLTLSRLVKLNVLKLSLT